MSTVNRPSSVFGPLDFLYMPTPDVAAEAEHFTYEPTRPHATDHFAGRRDF